MTFRAKNDPTTAPLEIPLPLVAAAVAITNTPLSAVSARFKNPTLLALLVIVIAIAPD